VTKKTDERGIHDLYDEDPLAADKKLWGRHSDPITRRGFLHGAGLTAMGAALGMNIPYARNMPAGLIPAALADTTEGFRIPGKHDGLVILNDRPINAETPAYLLNDDVTPNDRLFVRNNGFPPSQVDASTWTLDIGGESVLTAKRFSLEELKSRFPTQTLQLQLECGGNGRSEYRPRARGNQWSTGAVGCPEWTGIRLRDVLEECGIKDNAVYIGYYGADRHASGDPTKHAISRGVPIAKALEDETLLAFAINGGEIPSLHGAPLRLVCAGWPGSTSGKWLTRIDIRDRVHDGTKMTGKAYRVPCTPVAPGEAVDESKMCIIESMPVKSLITSIRSGTVHPVGEAISVGGHAWAGDLEVRQVELSSDFGQTWSRCKLGKPPNRLAWQRFDGELTFPVRGYYEIWARATDQKGRTQPMLVPGWNPKGYLNNACHRVAVRVA
jgi:DMSO/TMAO reductase YedYZ molybdopterin-dependent catalytic subunit